MAGSVHIEVLPQGDVKYFTEIRIEESHGLGRWENPQLFVSVNNQAEVQVNLSQVLRSLGVLTPHTEVQVIGEHITEPEEIEMLNFVNYITQTGWDYNRTTGKYYHFEKRHLGEITAKQLYDIFKSK